MTVQFQYHILNGFILTRNFVRNETKKIAWIVSNCGGHNDRHVYVKELQKYIQVGTSTGKS